ncbi:hypothetical protein BU17DRAFT_103437 [Hysterangium stoloniferum]|nr:hypothetical protein BU17DRAFT_103437 [Hysterangium stoloniferum]
MSTSAKTLDWNSTFAVRVQTPHSQLGHPSAPLHHGHPPINAVPTLQAQVPILQLALPQHYHPPGHPAANAQQQPQLAPPPAIPPPAAILPLAPPPAIAPPAVNAPPPAIPDPKAIPPLPLHVAQLPIGQQQGSDS